MATQSQRRQATREQLLQAAAELFDAQGYEDTTIDQIVARARLAKGTFYQHFESKIAILLAVVRAQQSVSQRDLLHDPDPRVAIEEYLQGVCRWFQEHALVAEALLWQSLKQKDLAQPNSTRGTLAKLLRRAQEQGQARLDLDAKALASYLTGVTVQATMAWTQAPEEPLWPQVQPLLRLFWEGAQCC
jgi:AcrR family transcriptional regulator